jgi:hypothetical protein
MYNPTQRLMRSRTEKVIAGVAGGIGQYLAIDPGRRPTALPDPVARDAARGQSAAGAC